MTDAGAIDVLCRLDQKVSPSYDNQKIRAKMYQPRMTLIQALPRRKNGAGAEVFIKVRVCAEGVALSDQQKKEILPMARIQMVMTRGKDDEKALYDLLGNKDERTDLSRQLFLRGTNHRTVRTGGQRRTSTSGKTDWRNRR